jgi:hypothetical protein
VAQGTNNIYVRAKNLRPAGTETGTVQLYYCKASLLMLPSQWRNNQVPTAGGATSVSFVNQSGSTQLSPNDICLTKEAFHLTDLPRVPEGEHYCLIAVVNTPNTRVSIPASFRDGTAFVQWVQNTPAVAWRNITIVPNKVKQIVQTMVFGNAGPHESLFHFTVRGRNLPKGTTVTVQCTNAHCPIDQTLVMPAPGWKGYQYTGFDQPVPGNFTSAITLTATPPQGQTFSPDSSLTVSYYEYPPAEPEMTDLHLEVGRFVSIARTAADGTSQVVTQHMIPMGECSIEIVGAG